MLGLTGSTLVAGCSLETIPPESYGTHAARNSRIGYFCLPPAFERERGVSWDGRIEWKTQERAWVFAAALEGSLNGIIRADSPYRLRVAVLRVEKQTGTFIVEFTVQDSSGERVELVQVEGVIRRNPSNEDHYRAVAGEIVTTFEKSVLR
jgi:hypothetical protein